MTGWCADIDALSFQPDGHEGCCVVHRRAFGTLLGFAPSPADCERYFDTNQSAFQRAAAAKITRAHLARASHFHLNSRDIARARAIKGWCPAVFEPMAASDGLLVTLKPRTTGWTAAQLRLIAQAGRQHGTGSFLLTHRAHLQVRGLTSSSVEHFAALMSEAEIASKDPDAERRRNILTATVMLPALQDLASRLEHWIESTPALIALPPKFTFAVCSNEPADIHIFEQGQQFVVMPAESDIGVKTDQPLAAVASLTEAFLGLSDRPRRMRDLLARLSATHLFLEAGLKPERFSRPALRSMPVGPLEGDCFAAAAPFGRVDADRLERIAGLAEGPVKLAAARAFVFTSANVGTLSKRVSDIGLIVDPTDSRLRIAACTGGSGCAHSAINILQLAECLAPHWHHEAQLHLSGCSKGCAHPREAALTCVANAAGDRMFVLKNSRADGAPSHSLPLDALAGLLSGYRPGRFDYVRDGAAIYRESFATIRREADLTAFSEEQARVVVRMIHACGMVDVAADVRMSGDLVSSARTALRLGAPILCDSEMVAHGITRTRLPADNRVVCTLSDPRTSQLALSQANTRSAAALELWREDLPGAVVAIGNAPTALFRLLEMLGSSSARPAAVIGVPVGFVGAAESKQALEDFGGIAFLTVRGRRGGSAMAAAALNALAHDSE